MTDMLANKVGVQVPQCPGVLLILRGVAVLA
jgi:hypothetical protein